MKRHKSAHPGQYQNQCNNQPHTVFLLASGPGYAAAVRICFVSQTRMSTNHKRLYAVNRKSQNSTPYLSLRPRKLGYQQPLTRLEVALAKEPVFHRALQTRQGHTIPNFQEPVIDGKGVIKDDGIGEVAHRKIVDPANRAWIHRSQCVHSIDRDPSSKHVNLLRLPSFTYRSRIAREQARPGARRAQAYSSQKQP